MGLANLFNPEIEGWTNFWFCNWIDHQEIQQAIQKKTGANEQVFVITPWADVDANGILQRHQQYHNNMNAALGIDGQDLSTLDFKDPRAVADWAYAHYQEHAQAHQALGF